MSAENQENDSSSPTTEHGYYLMKAEPDSRIVKGKEVKFSVDDFEAAGTTAWEGVRNYTARNIMQGMKLNEKVLFYHSNTKEPGIAGFAEVSREAYPDHTAWDKDHPYYDSKSDPSSPRWYMVDLSFVSRTKHFVPLALLRHLSTISHPPSQLSYLNSDDLQAIKGMTLLSSSRLSVQKVEKPAWDVIQKIADQGYEGFEIGSAKKAKKGTGPKNSKSKAVKEKEKETGPDDDDDEDGPQEEVPVGKKRKATSGKNAKRRVKRRDSNND